MMTFRQQTRTLIRKFIGSLALISLAPILSIDAQPSVVPRVAIEPTPLLAYQPFNVRVVFAKPACFSVSSPIYSSVTFKGGVLNLVLSHLKPGPCVDERVLPVSGLPAGTHTIQVSVTSDVISTTGPFFGSITSQTAIASTSLTVSERPGFTVTNMYTARVDSDSILGPFTNTEAGGGPVVLWQPRQYAGVGSGVGYYLEVGNPLADAYTFKFLAGAANTSAQKLPDPYESFYIFRFPSPAQGVFAATSVECLPLYQTWAAQPALSVCPTANSYVLRYKNGACPLGATPVYRLFHPISIAHRYTQSAETYAELQNFGYRGEGPAFCAPTHE